MELYGVLPTRSRSGAPTTRRFLPVLERSQQKYNQARAQSLPPKNASSRWGQLRTAVRASHALQEEGETVAIRRTANELDATIKGDASSPRNVKFAEGDTAPDEDISAGRVVRYVLDTLESRTPRQTQAQDAADGMMNQYGRPKGGWGSFVKKVKDEIDEDELSPEAAVLQEEGRRLRDMQKNERAMFQAETEYLQKKLTQYKEQNAELKDNVRKNESVVQERVQERSLLDQEALLLEDEIAAYRAELEMSYARSKADSEKIQNLEDCLQRLNEGYSGVQEETIQNIDQHEKLEKELIAVKKQLADVDKEIEALQSENKDYKHHLDKKEEQTSENVFASDKDDAKRKLSEFIQREVLEQVQSYRSISDEASESPRVSGSALEMIRNAYTEIAGLRNEYDQLSQAHEQLRESSNESLLRCELLRWRQRHRQLQDEYEALTVQPNEKGSKEEDRPNSGDSQNPNSGINALSAGSSGVNLLMKSFQDLLSTSTSGARETMRQRRRRKLRQRKVAALLEKELADAENLNKASEALLEVVGGDEPSRTAQKLRDHVYSLRRRKFKFRKARLIARSRMKVQLESQRSALERASWDAKVREDGLHQEIYSLQAKVKEAKEVLAERSGVDGITWLATVHNFFVEQISLLQAQIETDGADIRRLEDLQSKPHPEKGSQELDQLSLEICRRRREETATRLAQVKTGISAVEKDRPELAESTKQDLPQEGRMLAKGGAVPYQRRLAGESKVEIQIQTDPAGFMASRTLWSGIMPISEEAAADVTALLLQERDVLFKVCLDDLEFPLFLYVALDAIRLPPTIPCSVVDGKSTEHVNFDKLFQKRFSQDKADEAWLAIGHHLKTLLSLEYVNDWPKLVLEGQESDIDAEDALANLETQDEPIGGLGSEIVSDTIEIHGVPVEVRVFSARRVQWGMTFVNVHAYEPLSGWSRWCTMRASLFFRMMGIYSIPELQARAARLQIQELLESFASNVFASDLANRDLSDAVFKTSPALKGPTTYLYAELPARKKELMIDTCGSALAFSFAVEPDGGVSCKIVEDT